MAHNAAMSNLATLPFSAMPAQALPVSERWGVRVLSLMVWALAAGALAFWLLGARAGAAGSTALPAETALHSDEAALARLLGHVDAPAQPASGAAAPAVAAPAAGRFVLQGAVANALGGGIAVIATDGQPARPYRIGQKVVDDWVLQSVGLRSARLRGLGNQTLDLKFPATGTGGNLAGGSVPAYGAAAPVAQPAVPAAVPPVAPVRPMVPGQDGRTPIPTGQPGLTGVPAGAVPTQPGAAAVARPAGDVNATVNVNVESRPRHDD